jgi:hypothetical protein
MSRAQTSRRQFITTASALAATPVLLGLAPLRGQRRAAPPSDPMMEYFQREAQRIAREIEAGDRGPSQARALESLLRVQAVHFVAKGYNDAIKAAVAKKSKSMGREAFAAEIQAAIPAGKPQPLFDDLVQALKETETQGIVARWNKHADLLKENGPHMRDAREQAARLVKAGGQWWWPWNCQNMAQMMAIDDAMLAIFCGMAFFFGGEAICALWAIELGAEHLLYEVVC